MEQILKETGRQLAHINDITPKQALRRAFKTLAGKRVSPQDPVFWPAGMLMLGLVEAGDKGDGSECHLNPKVTFRTVPFVTYLDAWIDAGARVMHTDDALAGYVLVRLYALTGEERYLKAAEKIYAFLQSAPKDVEGSIIYHPEIGEDNRIIYADGAGMTALFLAAYGRQTRNEDATELARTQVANFLQYGMDEKTGLPYHAYDLASGEKLGIVGWGRAVGWLMMGMSELVKADEKGDGGDKGDGSECHLNPKVTFRTVPFVTSFFDRVVSYLRADGSFAWQLPAMEGHADTSATAMIGWAMLNAGTGDKRDGSECHLGVSGDIQNRPFCHLASIRDYLLSQTHDGVVTSALGECVDYGQYPQVYGTYPWGQGAVCAFLARLSRR